MGNLGKITETESTTSTTNECQLSKKLDIKRFIKQQLILMVKAVIALSFYIHYFTFLLLPKVAKILKEFLKNFFIKIQCLSCRAAQNRCLFKWNIQMFQFLL